MSTSSVVLKFEQAAEQPFESTCRIVGFVKLRHLAPLLTAADLESNPRSSKVGSITEAITESLDRTPDTFAAKTKGILVGTGNYRPRERQRYELEFANPLLEGILDGGHNALALGLRILSHAGVDDQLVGRVRLWSDFKKLWDANLKRVEAAVKDADDQALDVLVPVELLVPSDPEDAATVERFSAALLDVCAARNNNAQLRAETRANQQGYFEALKELLPPTIADDVEWKTNDGGRIKAADVIALSWIPLSKLDLPKDEDGRQVEAPVAQNIYRSKGDCVTRFERLMSSSDVTIPGPDGYRRDLKSSAVRSAFQVTADLLDLYDVIYRRLPDAYNSNDGKFGRITAVKKMNPDGSSRKKYAKFSHKQVATAIPDGFVIPLVVGLKSLMDVSDSGEVRWKTDPLKFLDDHFDTVVGDFKSAIALLEYDPQKVGKAPEAYRMAEVAYEMVLLRKGK
ncbi:hypothetical protein ACWFOS_15395 [Gordonia terrae]